MCKSLKPKIYQVKGEAGKGRGLCCQVEQIAEEGGIPIQIGLWTKVEEGKAVCKCNLGCVREESRPSGDVCSSCCPPEVFRCCATACLCEQPDEGKCFFAEPPTHFQCHHHQFAPISSQEFGVSSLFGSCGIGQSCSGVCVRSSPLSWLPCAGDG